MIFQKDHRHHLMHNSIRPGSNPGDAPQECTLQQLFSRPVPISGTKYNHLLELKSVILQDYHVFYDSLDHD